MGTDAGPEKEGGEVGDPPRPAPSLRGGRRPQLGEVATARGHAPAPLGADAPGAAGGPRGAAAPGLCGRGARGGAWPAGGAPSARRSEPAALPAPSPREEPRPPALAGPSPGRRAAAAGRRLPGRAAAGRGRGPGVRGPRAGLAGFGGRAAATPAPQAGRPPARATGTRCTGLACGVQSPRRGPRGGSVAHPGSGTLDPGPRSL